MENILSDVWLTTGIVLVYCSLFAGALGAFIPVIPGPALGFGAILVFKLCFPEVALSWQSVILVAILCAVAQVADILFSWLGAKKFGSTWRGALGAVLGAIVGIFIPPPILWIFIAPVIFAALFEYLGGANIRESGLAGVGAFLGTLVASIFKFFIILIMSLIFTYALIYA